MYSQLRQESLATGSLPITVRHIESGIHNIATNNSFLAKVKIQIIFCHFFFYLCIETVYVLTLGLTDYAGCILSSESSRLCSLEYMSLGVSISEYNGLALWNNLSELFINIMYDPNIKIMYVVSDQNERSARAYAPTCASVGAGRQYGNPHHAWELRGNAEVQRNACHETGNNF